MKRFVFGISGASGPVIGIRILRELLKSSEVYLIASAQSFSILRDESGVDWHAGSDAAVEKKVRAYFRSKRLFYCNENDMAAPVSSGSFRTDGMFIVPCSMKTLSGVANGYTENLIQRAADVTMKEGRPLLLCPREMPFSAVHLENMLKLARLGVKIAPPVPGFYHKPGSIDDIIDFI
ncbi:MAG TPA: UbiX family flavin prenyltransferase, partial [Thermodesulfovibrionales bacterium]|nr:UbiX family flavin prenyltransferase [Thermodesulfovibrionales bacterium]